MAIHQGSAPASEKPKSWSPLVKAARPHTRLGADESAERLDPVTRGERLMTLTEVAEMLSIPLDMLYAWRHRGLGPSGYRVGRHVRYRRSVVESWLETRADDRN